ncbi:MAG: endonuclease/exonuclease/phosphatase family protein, partial [Clostridia bacterium]|nr:endonuclease/exonuclease/phosphatase family protein [Clostridia bacterium]
IGSVNMKSKHRRFINAIAVIMSFVIITTLSYVSGFVIGNYQNNTKPAENTPPGEKVTVMTFNICSTTVGKKTWEERTEAVTDLILDSSADSIGLQEATPYWMEVLHNSLGSLYDYVGVGSNSASGYTDNDDYNDEFTAIFYLKNKYSVADSGYFWLSQTPEKSSYGWNSAYKRICTWVVLENKKTKKKYVHINAHFDNASSEARRNSIPMILEKVKAFKDLPVVFTGDLNFIETSRGYADITADVLRDVKYSAKDTMSHQTFNGADAKSFKDYILDYALINNKFAAKSYKVITKKRNGGYISDHYPVTVNLEIC